MNGKHLKKWHLVFAFLIAFIFFAPSFADAANGSQSVTECWQNPDAEGCEDTTPAVEEENASSTVGLGIWDYLKMLLTLVFVLALLIFVLKFLSKKSASYQQNSVIRNIGGISVGSQKSIQLLHIGDKLYIVGVGEDVQLIKEINDPTEVQDLLDTYQEKQTMATSPYIMELLNKLKSPNKEESNDTEKSANFGDMFKKRLTDIQKTRQHELEKWKEKEKDK
ncbi:flagellar protein [Lysinibacillus yapensis]|uniref:Flagellar protein n=1 Tax=Ureibacillus yapensis TaxID=2304605 RepID=A0A396SE95_9BACL|nr:flagellar biosynthetic protein FliO [Lysinibacillus yapensis]RHW39634.1 flagellar protein [Lysinibacillus yapensis]